jgi:SSS family solute:Na+ symporter
MKNLSALYDIPLFALLVLGILFPRIPTAAALAAVGCGLCFYVTFGFLLDNRIFGKEFHWLHVAAMNFVLICSVMGLVTWFHPRTEIPPQEAVAAVELRPWRWAIPLSVGIAAAASLIYLGLWWVGSGSI